jgi:hypothetical protein
MAKAIRSRKKKSFQNWLPKSHSSAYLSNIKWFATQIGGMSETFFYRDTDEDDIPRYKKLIKKLHGARGRDAKSALSAYLKFLEGVPTLETQRVVTLDFDRYLHHIEIMENQLSVFKKEVREAMRNSK